MARLIVFPISEARICGFPDTVRLTNAEARAMERIHLGGLEALRQHDYKCSCNTIDSLIRKGLLHPKQGITPLGKRVAESCARPVDA